MNHEETTPEPGHTEHFDNEGEVEAVEVMRDMTATADAEAAKEAAAIPPPVEMPTPPEFVSFEPPAAIEFTEPPPQQDILSEMGEVTAVEAGFDKKEAAKEKRTERAQQKTNERKERLGQDSPFPFRVSPPAPQDAAMREMGEIAKEIGPGATGQDVRQEWERRHTEQMDAPGDEQAMVMQQRGGAVLEAFNRAFDTQSKLLAKMGEMLTAHEQKLHAIDGLLERGRT